MPDTSRTRGLFRRIGRSLQALLFVDLFAQIDNQATSHERNCLVEDIGCRTFDSGAKLLLGGSGTKPSSTASDIRRKTNRFCEPEWQILVAKATVALMILACMDGWC